MFEDGERAEGARIKPGFETIMHWEYDVHRSLRFGGCDHFAFVPRCFHSHDTGSRQHQMPLRHIHIILSVGEWVVGARRHDLLWGWTDRCGRWSLLTIRNIRHPAEQRAQREAGYNAVRTVESQQDPVQFLMLVKPTADYHTTG